MRAASTALRGCRWRITRSGKADEERRVEGRFKAATREGMRERNSLEKERERERKMDCVALKRDGNTTAGLKGFATETKAEFAF